MIKSPTKTDLLKFNFKFLDYATRDLYEIIDATFWSKNVNASKPKIHSNCISVWTDDCVDHPMLIHYDKILCKTKEE